MSEISNVGGNSNISEVGMKDEKAPPQPGDTGTVEELASQSPDGEMSANSGDA